MESSGKEPRSPPPEPATHRILPRPSWFHEMGGNLADDLSRFIVNPGMASEIAGIMVSHLLLRFHVEVKVFKKLG